MLRKIALYILLSPLIVILILFDIVKIPALIIMSPLWLYMDAIACLKGEKSMYMEFIADAGTIGLRVVKEILDPNSRF